MGKIGVLLVNLGTPDDPGTKSVRRYLNQFLLDGRVIDVNPVLRHILVRGQSPHLEHVSQLSCISSYGQRTDLL